mgnify:CR=1 FL=1
MKWLLVMILLVFVSGCVSARNNAAVCDGTTAARREHAAALGARLIRLMDAGCR